ncbi:YtxH domain-containing protein [Georgenia yuyongxinii]|uniref:YtxH domain-containing protein n=1 Tax=Georgenia yuyongxinii TaxID=2589797 RepID=A0A552WR12_9MICO|nr:YtxH domain-containing protein [Georgenia yuyongxinii]TRW45220.1 YtxH domain-containing protein [Georgenia yuyongxinii]
MGKFSFVVGAGIGYLFGTRAGRGQYERLKKAGSSVWTNPRVQQGVQKVETKVGDVARERTAAMTDKVAATVKDKIRGPRAGNGVHDSSGGYSSGGYTATPGTTPPRPTEPTPPIS